MDEDNVIAEIIAEEARRRRERARSAGVLAYLEPEPTSSSIDINKRFLGNIVQSVCNHNRRNQEDQSWRQHKLDEILEESDRKRRTATDDSSSHLSNKRPLLVGSSSSPSSSQQQSRDEWAQRKANALLAATQSPSQLSQEPKLPTSEPIASEAILKKNKKNKKEKKKKHHKEKKNKKKKEKKHKKHDSSSSSSSDEDTI
jgi:hypothetical protein